MLPAETKKFLEKLCVCAISPQPMPCKSFRRTSPRALECAAEVFCENDPSARPAPGHHCPTVEPPTAHRRATRATLACTSAPAPSGNSSECIGNTKYGHKTDTAGMLVSTQHQQHAAYAVAAQNIQEKQYGNSKLKCRFLQEGFMP